VETQIVLLTGCAVLFVLGLPLAFRLVPPNRIYGFRTSVTLSRPDIWYRTNVFAGYAFMVAAAITALVISCVPELSPLAAAVVGIALVLCATAASFAYVKRIA
jgi:uncharacterized membrane protein